jgi:hypothetical protein
LKARSLRANHHSVYQFLFFLFVIFSFVFPSYNIFLVEVRSVFEETKCDVNKSNSLLYLKMTFIFVLLTTAIPFVLIFISNSSIIYAIYTKRKLFNDCKSVNPDRTIEKKNIAHHYRRIAFKNKSVELNLEQLNIKQDPISRASSTGESPWHGKFHKKLLSKS